MMLVDKLKTVLLMTPIKLIQLKLLLLLLPLLLLDGAKVGIGIGVGVGPASGDFMTGYARANDADTTDTLEKMVADPFAVEDALLEENAPKIVKIVKIIFSCVGVAWPNERTEPNPKDRPFMSRESRSSSPSSCLHFL